MGSWGLDRGYNGEIGDRDVEFVELAAVAMLGEQGGLP